MVSATIPKRLRIGFAKVIAILAAVIAVLAPTYWFYAHAQEAPTYATDIPEAITTPDVVETRIGTLNFFDGLPDPETVAVAYDHLDFIRGVDTFLKGIPATSLYAMREGLQSAGVIPNTTIGVFEDLMDSQSLFLTPNTTTIYVMGWIDLKDGPIVVDATPGVLGAVNDLYFRYVTDIGQLGPDEGAGGKYLFLPPGYEGDVPEGYFTFESPTYGNWLLLRAFPLDGDRTAGVAQLKENLQIYALADSANPPETEFVNLSGVEFSTIHANDFHFYEELNEVIQEEPASAFGPELMGIFRSIGIIKGQPFAPDERMRDILTDAAAVGNATARAITFSPRDPESFYYPDRQWKTAFVGGDYQFLDEGARRLDARILFHYYATVVTPAMAAKNVGQGSQYAYTERDSDRNYLDGSKSYRITVPPNVPVNNFWSFVIYDNQSRSMLQTDNRFPAIDSNFEGLQYNDDGSVDLYFGPEAPEGWESNWVQTWPGKTWHTIFRLYGPLEPWFDGTWKLNDFELLD